MANKFEKAVKNRTSEILESGKDAPTKSPIDNNLNDENLVNLSSIIDVKEKSGKNKTFYLDTEVIKYVKKHAKVQKVSESKLVNDILKHVFKI
ncbi:hypothetical protein AAGC94_08140 [Clostridium sporogenes]|uniref:hypothetical protein n=1 Tax=Clostridium TaxID=1485 RepID=UPI0015711B42|nr:hypothetical protein [Clostridium cochlearium]MBV1821968.1 hypothetical protein [Bacteroidales bacterium MSK.15.36]NSJ92855.1 hypothetical protein [Coprococcus sp. MSK.21.13]MCG4572764.1 hypothetical protein [Clostridium cochlearium]MCG4572767.1 hypothetical protein [Clostridium cochlearium]MCG4580693.1 hypothetical protein [Clostridium cochlearium]